MRGLAKKLTGWVLSLSEKSALGTQGSLGLAGFIVGFVNLIVVHYGCPSPSAKPIHRRVSWARETVTFASDSITHVVVVFISKPLSLHEACKKIPKAGLDLCVQAPKINSLACQIRQMSDSLFLCKRAPHQFAAAWKFGVTYIPLVYRLYHDHYFFEQSPLLSFLLSPSYLCQRRSLLLIVEQLRHALWHRHGEARLNPSR